ncbi:MAG TPA: hypothetical protein VK550_28830 [Polyangiaceae bacterium]|nr:hypothetical protein [Polyangiaceae bacterium]
MRNFGCFVLLPLAIVLSSPGARGQSNSEPVVEQGLKLRREGRDGEALALFREAYDARPSPRTKAQIALAEQALSLWVEAERDLQLALEADADPWISTHRETLGKALEAIRQHLATLDVMASVDKAELWVNDVRAGRLPILALRVPSGSVRLEVRAEGHEPAFRSVVLAAEGAAVEEFQLPGTDEPAASPAPKSTVENGPAALVATPPAASPAAPAPFATRRALAWGTLGAAGAFLGGAIVAQIINESNTSTYYDDAQCSYGGLSRDQRCGVYRGQAESAQMLATIGYIAAGTLGIGSAILFLTSPTKKASSGVRVGVDVRASGAAFMVGGSL